MPVFWIKRKGLNPFMELGFRKGNLREIALYSLLLFFMLLGASLLLGAVLDFFGANDLEKVSVQAGVLVPAFLAALIVVRGISEEVFFRAFLVPRFGVLAPSALFAVFHAAYGSIAEVLGAFVLGLILAYFYQKKANIYPNILAHVGYNIAALSLIG